MAEHVFVETNWVVDCVAPALAPGPAANELLERARTGDSVLHLPAICLVEARKVVRCRTVGEYADAFRRFVRGERDAGRFQEDRATAAFETIGTFESFLQKEKAATQERIDGLLRDAAIHVFPLNEAMLARSVTLSGASTLELESFDLAILAAILEAAAPLRVAGHTISFCTLDRDLLPWNRKGAPKPELQGLYDRAGVWVSGDFLFDVADRPDPWPPA